MRCRHAVVQDVGLLYQRLSKYQRKRDHAIRMMTRIEAEIGEAHRQQQRQQRLRTACVRPSINCAGAKCRACGIMFRILRYDPEGRSTVFGKRKFMEKLTFRPQFTINFDDFFFKLKLLQLPIDPSRSIFQFHPRLHVQDS